MPLTEVTVHTLDGREVTVQSAYISNANILFAREIEEGQSRQLGREVEHKLYPFVSKSTVPVKLHVPPYTLTGQMHCVRGERVGDVLNSEPRFFSLTNVDIYPSAGGSESGVSFIAVNKGQIISLEELG